MSSHSATDSVLDSSALGTVSFDSDSFRNESRSQSSDVPSAIDVLNVVTGLGKQDIQTLIVVSDHERVTTRELATLIDRDRSSINRSLKRLRRTDLITRRRRLLDSGGEFYEYYAAPKAQREAIARQAIEQWATAAARAIASYDWELSSS